MQDLKIGLFGFGCVGQGLYYAIQHSIRLKTHIKKIVVKNPNKARPIDASLFSYDKRDILLDEDINVVVELIDDAEEAYRIVSEALRRGKHVVTANKKMLALYLPELLSLKAQHGVSLLYEAAACGSIPIIRTLEEYFDNEALTTIYGIFNGTTNYILTKTMNEGLTYAQALAQAQENGFAEADPTNDVEGFDALYKTVILMLHGFGVLLPPDSLFRMGIVSLQVGDMDYARRRGYAIKLVPTIQQNGQSITAYVLPRFVAPSQHIFNVQNEFNGVVVASELSGEQFFFGRGAGSHPTGAAVFSDISALSYAYEYENKKLKQQPDWQYDDTLLLHLFVSSANPENVAAIPFIETITTYSEKGYAYKTGIAPLSALRLIDEKGIRKDIFIAVLPERVV